MLCDVDDINIFHSDSEYYQKMQRDLQQLIDELSSSDVAKYIDFPQIAVMGDTSAGKSSLLTAVGGIEFPSSEVLTTRCPMRLVMKQSEGEFKGSVGIVWKLEDHSPDPQKYEAVDCTEPGQVTKEIAKAQDFIMSATTAAPRDMARDLVDIKIESKDLCDLTLVDLPGYVAVAGDSEKKDIVEGVTRLITDYLENPQTVIVAVCPATIDFHNSQILAEAEKVDPTQERTLVVVTKPDEIPDDCEGSVIDLINGNKKKFVHGFHVVKCRSQRQVNNNLSLGKSIANEDKFFEDPKLPWSKSVHPTKRGTKMLRQKLSRMQQQIIKRQFPKIVKEITVSYEEVLSELEDVPVLETPRDKRACIESIGEKLFRSLQGMMEKGEFRLAVAELKEEFAAEVGNLKIVDDTLLFCSTEGRFYYSNHPPVGMADDKRTSNSESECGGQFPGSCVIILETGMRGHALLESSTGSFVIQISDGSICTLNRNQFSVDATELMIPLLKHTRTRSIPIFISEEVFNEWVGRFIKEEVSKVAENFTSKLFMLVKNCVCKEVDEIIGKVTSKHENLCKVIIKMKAAFDEREDDVDEALQRQLKTETFPHTNNSILENNIRKRRSDLLKSRVLSCVERQGTTVEDVRRIFEENLSNKSAYECQVHDLQVALQSYWEVASVRMADTIPQELDDILTRDMNFCDLRGLDDEEIAHYMAVAPYEEIRFLELQQKRDVLKKALGVLGDSTVTRRRHKAAKC